MTIELHASFRTLLVLQAVSLAFGLATLGCGGSDPPPLGSLEPNSTTHPGAVSTLTGGMPIERCVPTPPPSQMITDFSDWSGTSWGSPGGLTGASFAYQGEETSSSGEFAYQVDRTAENMHVSGVVNDYAGFGISIELCTDAAAAGFIGVQFDIWGTANSHVFQVQTSEDQNIEYADNATCQIVEDGDECVVPQVRIGVVPESQETLQFTWEEFSGGQPVPTVSPNQIVGFQWQFECAAGGMCPVDVRIDNVTFF